MSLRLLPPAKDDPFLLALREGLSRDHAQHRDAALLRERSLSQQVHDAPADGAARLALAACRSQLGDYAGSLPVLVEGARMGSRAGPAVSWAAMWALQQAARTEEARDLAGTAAQQFEGREEFGIARELLLPPFYDSVAHRDACRARFAEGLARVTRTAPDERLAGLVRALGLWTNYYLAYQGGDDLELNRTWGAWLRDVMVRSLGDGELSATARTARKRRIGFVAQHMHRHSVGLCMLGWVECLDRSRYDVFSYHLGSEDDEITARFRASSRSLVRSQDVGAMREAMVRDELDVLVFLDVGMAPAVTQLAALRLAPVQCATWGHSVTTGLPTIDYFLSAEAMEPQDAQRHYSEALVRLPGVGFAPAHERVSRAAYGLERSQFGIRDDAVVFLCPHTLSKHLPQHDVLFAQIARRVPAAQLVFVGGFPLATDRFRARLHSAFAREGLQVDERCLFLPPLGALEFSQLYLLSDVYLDALEWSGCNTTLEAVDRGLPVVTYEGRFQRGRQSAALVRAAGVAELVTGTVGEYVDVAVRLGVDVAWREDVGRRLAAASAQGRLRRRDHMPALEAFFSEA